MCGVAYTSFNSTAPVSSMRHRGPDISRSVPVDRGTLHHSLLAIHGEQYQPIASGNALAVYNGELYGIERDSRAMVEGFGADGAKFLRSVNGDWAMLSVEANIVTAVRDRYGLRPLFRYWDGERLVYASNVAIIREVLAQCGVILQPSGQYSPRGRIPKPSAYRHIEPLPPGVIETATHTDSTWTIDRRRWYKLHAHRHGGLESLLRDAVDLRQHSRGVVAVSGGVDSYLLAMFAPDLPRYHLDVTGEGDAARDLGAVILQPPIIDAGVVDEVLEQPFYALPPNLFLAKAIKQHRPTVRVVLTGIGADEVFGGYLHHTEPYNDTTSRRVYGIPHDPACEDWRQAEFTHSIPYHYGYRPDQAFLRYGIEARYPYLDHRVVETALCEPADGKVALCNIARALGWQEQPKRGFAANLGAYVRGGPCAALQGMELLL